MSGALRTLGAPASLVRAVVIVLLAVQCSSGSGDGGAPADSASEDEIPAAQVAPQGTVLVHTDGPSASQSPHDALESEDTFAVINVGTGTFLRVVTYPVSMSGWVHTPGGPVLYAPSGELALVGEDGSILTEGRSIPVSDAASGRLVLALTWGEDSLWATARDSDGQGCALVEIDAITLQPRREIRIDNLRVPSAVGVVHDELWVATYGDSTLGEQVLVYGVDPEAGAIVETAELQEGAAVDSILALPGGEALLIGNGEAAIVSGELSEVAGDAPALDGLDLAGPGEDYSVYNTNAQSAAVYGDALWLATVSQVGVEGSEPGQLRRVDIGRRSVGDPVVLDGDELLQPDDCPETHERALLSIDTLAVTDDAFWLQIGLTCSRATDGATSVEVQAASFDAETGELITVIDEA